MRIAIDAMGGDHAPGEIVRGAVEAIRLLDPSDRLLLVGRPADIEAHLHPHPAAREHIEIIPATDVITMEDAPVDAIKHKKDSSILVAVQLAADGKADAVLSAGNTGAFAAACQLRLRTIGAVQRPGIAVTIPSFYGPLTLCDVGANVAPKPVHLYQYAHMATIFSQKILGIERPRVALLSIGEESVKGSALVKGARDLIRQDPRLSYVGYVEGRDLFTGKCEVVITDGFVGNVVLKLSEGLSQGLFRTIEQEIAAECPDLTDRFRSMVAAIWRKHDYAEYGGAPLLGVGGVCIICHGSSDHRAIANAVRCARNFVLAGLNPLMAARLTEETVDA